MYTMATPSFRRRRTKSNRISASWKLSAAVGSSRMSTLASRLSARAISMI